MAVVIEDFVGGAGIHHRQGRTASSDGRQFVTERHGFGAPGFAGQPLTQCHHDCLGESLTGAGRQFPGEPIRFRIFDAQSHIKIIYKREIVDFAAAGACDQLPPGMRRTRPSSIICWNCSVKVCSTVRYVSPNSLRLRLLSNANG